MASAEFSSSTNLLLQHLRRQLLEFESEGPSLVLRDHVLIVLEIQDTVRGLGVSIAVEAGLSKTSARSRIEDYFRQNAGQVIDGEELSAVSGISEYARRVREIRRDGRLQIKAGQAGRDPRTGERLRPDQYILETD